MSLISFKTTLRVSQFDIYENAMNFSISGLQKLTLQSQSFPDLTHRIDTKIGPYTSNKMSNGDGINKLTKLPAASR